MKIYLVGGAVRDALLGLPVSERDYVVVGADANQMLDLGYKPLDQDFPVFRHPQTGDEYALARRERKSGIGYKGFEIVTGPGVTLEEDLVRRDLTINAIAQDLDGNIVDPLHGQTDLQIRCLRHITPNFAEDPVRLLRIARFAARFAHLGFGIPPATLRILCQMTQHAELVSLYPHRLRDELLRALATKSPWQFFITLHHCGALTMLLPELAAAMGTTSLANIDSSSSAPITVLQRATTITPNIAVRWVAFIQVAIPNQLLAAELCQKLVLERDILKLMELSSTWPAQRVATAIPESLLQMLESHRLLQHPQQLQSLMQVWQALEPVEGSVAATRITTALQAASAVRVTTLADCGLVGKDLGIALRQQRILSIAQALEAAFSLNVSTLSLCSLPH